MSEDSVREPCSLCLRLQGATLPEKVFMGPYHKRDMEASAELLPPGSLYLYEACRASRSFCMPLRELQKRLRVLTGRFARESLVEPAKQPEDLRVSHPGWNGVLVTSKTQDIFWTNKH